MRRPPLPAPRPRRDSGFRWRSTEVSRVEGFSDAVFGFAVTLLVVSLEPPRTFAALLELMRGFPAFAASFAILVLIWHAQYVFFRRYALDDRPTLLLNVAMLFVVLLYVYPLKFLFATLMSFALGDYQVALGDGTLAPLIRAADWPTLMTIYGVGYVAVFGIFALLYRHAWRCRAQLELNALEVHLTRQSVRENVIMVAFGVISITLAHVVSPVLAGWSYALIGPVQGLAAWYYGRGAPTAESAAEPAPQR